MNVTYICASMFEARKPGGIAMEIPFDCETWDEFFEDGYDNEWLYGIWMLDTAAETSKLLAVDGGEPEDNRFYRDGAWIAPALNEAYKAGYAEGLLSCCGKED